MFFRAVLTHDNTAIQITVRRVCTIGDHKASHICWGGGLTDTRESQNTQPLGLQFRAMHAISGCWDLRIEPTAAS